MAVDEAEYARQVRQVAKGSGWAVRQGTLSLIRDATAYHVYHFGDQLYLMAKPTSWDDLFWPLMDVTFKRPPGPSRYWWGASCPAPKRAMTVIHGSDPGKRAAKAWDFAQDGLRQMSGVDLSVVPKKLIPSDRPGDFVITEVIILLAKGDVAGARRLSRDVIEGRRRAQYNIRGRDGRSLFQRVIDRAGELTS